MSDIINHLARLVADIELTELLLDINDDDDAWDGIEGFGTSSDELADAIAELDDDDYASDSRIAVYVAALRTKYDI